MGVRVGGWEGGLARDVQTGGCRLHLQEAIQRAGEDVILEVCRVTRVCVWGCVGGWEGGLARGA